MISGVEYNVKMGVMPLNGLVKVEYDSIYCYYTDSDLTSVVYKKNQQIVATVTMTYTDHVLQSTVVT